MVKLNERLEMRLIKFAINRYNYNIYIYISKPNIYRPARPTNLLASQLASKPTHPRASKPAIQPASLGTVIFSTEK